MRNFSRYDYYAVICAPGVQEEAQCLVTPKEHRPTAITETTLGTGFPTIWARNIRNIVPRHNGTPVTAVPAIGEQANRDPPFSNQMRAPEGNDLLNRTLTPLTTIDRGDIGITFPRYLMGRDKPRAIPRTKVNDVTCHGPDAGGFSRIPELYASGFQGAFRDHLATSRPGTR